VEVGPHSPVAAAAAKAAAKPKATADHNLPVAAAAAKSKATADHNLPDGLSNSAFHENMNTFSKWISKVSIQ
jgi:hypothetical protein